MQVVVDSLLTSYERAGTGPVILFLHGWGDSAQGFSQLTTALQAEYTIVAVDLPGFGSTQPPQESWGVEDYALFVSHFLEKIEIDKVHAVIAHSNGGTIAIKALATKKVASDSLVLLASAGIRDVYKGRKKALRLAAKAAKAATYPLPKTIQSKLKKKAYKTIGSDMFVAEHLQETFKKVVTDDVQADAATLKLPTLLIYGSQDQATPVSYGQRFHKAIHGSDLEVLEGAEHFVHHDEPEKVLMLIKGFLA